MQQQAAARPLAYVRGRAAESHYIDFNTNGYI
jgi:hypothetical protein